MKQKLELNPNQGQALICMLYKTLDGDSEKLLKDFFQKDNINICDLSWELEKTFDIVTPPRWRAERGEEYYFVNICGEVAGFTDDRRTSDDNIYNSGNYFRTREQAEPFAKKVREVFRNWGDGE